MAAPALRSVLGWALAAAVAAGATVSSAAPLSGAELPGAHEEVERVEVNIAPEPEDPHACEIRCGVKRYRAACEARETPVCQCDYKPFARCSDPEKRKPARR